MTEAEAADYLRRPAGMLRQWRYRCQGPAYVREGRLVRYLRRDLDAYLEAGRVEPPGGRLMPPPTRRTPGGPIPEGSTSTRSDHHRHDEVNPDSTPGVSQ